MGVANSRAVIVLVFIVVLASYSKPTLVDAKSKLWCKAICELKCGGIFEAVHCFDQCYDHCRSEKAKASPVDICNYGCVMTSCVDSLGNLRWLTNP